jgi:hypothetical protein
MMSVHWASVQPDAVTHAAMAFFLSSAVVGAGDGTSTQTFTPRKHVSDVWKQVHFLALSVPASLVHVTKSLVHFVAASAALVISSWVHFDAAVVPAAAAVVVASWATAHATTTSANGKGQKKD